MVGSTQHRSPSPVLSRSNPSPNSRSITQEREGFGARKSFSGHPFPKSSLISQQRGLIPNTPVNSPPEYSRRSSFGRECADLKENSERDPNVTQAARGKSPSIITKGSKHFMSPTISAASKINPSPRKKVLGERNETIRTSASLSDGKFHFFSTSSLEFDDEAELKSDQQRLPCSATFCFDKAENGTQSTEPEKNVAGSRFGEEKIETSQADLVVLSPEISLYASKSSEPLPVSEMPKLVADKNVGLGANTSPCAIAPLDADPPLAPYDPKTNYLSPRPQFLHYNPNKRIESFVNQGVNLDDDFTSESVTETENSSEEVLSGESQKDQEDAASSVGTSPDESSSASEAIPVGSQQFEERFEAKLEPKPQLFSTWRTVAVLLLILLGSLSVAMTLYPGFGNAVHGKEIVLQIYNDPRAVAELAKDSLNGLTEKTRLWSAHSVGFLSQIYNDPHPAAELAKESLHGLIENARQWSVHFVGYLSQIYNDPRAVAELAKEGLNGLIENARLCSVHYVGYLSQKIQNVRGADELSSLTYYNLTSLQEEDWNYAAINVELGPHLERAEQVFQTTSDSAEDFSDLESLPEPEADEIEPQAGDAAAYEVPAESNESSQYQNEAGDAATAEVPAGSDESPKYQNDLEENDTAAVDASLEDDVEPGKVEETSIGQEETVIPVEDLLMQNEDPVDLMTEQAVTDTAAEGLNTDLTVVDQSQSDVEDELLFSLPRQSPEIESHHTEHELSTEADVSPPVGVQSEETETINSVSGSLLVEEATEGDSQLQEATTKAPLAAAIALLVASVLTVAAAFLYLKPRKATPTAADQFVAKEKTRYTQVGSNMELSRCETLSSWSGPTEVDMIGESCPSQMSSFQTSSYAKSKQKGVDEAQSQHKSSKRSHKRESLSAASDYTMSESYGSFTTYSIMHPKHRDDEMVTPVRRSSRIRSKVTSP